MDYQELLRRLVVSAKDVPNNIENAKRVWDVWILSGMYDPNNRQAEFAKHSGLGNDLVIPYMKVCRQFELDRAAAQRRARPAQPQN